MTLSTIKSILAGIGGTMVLVVFCSTFIALEKVLMIIPLFVAFNGTMTGYRLVEVLKEKIKGLFLFSFVMGLGTGAAVFLMIHVAGTMTNNHLGLGLWDLGLYTIISGVTSYLGAVLAVRYFNLEVS